MGIDEAAAICRPLCAGEKEEVCEDCKQPIDDCTCDEAEDHSWGSYE